jgi:hypothetical protein
MLQQAYAEEIAMRRPLLIVAPLLLAASPAALAADAAPAAARKSGLWEITNTIGGPHPMAQTLQQCVDEKTDRLTEQSSLQEARKHCARNDVAHAGNKVVADSVCSIDGTSVTTHAEFTGDFSRSYRGDVRTSYQPPMQGVKDLQMSIAAKWLGPCLPGQQPGDVILPGGTRFNAQDLQKRAK